MAFKNAVRSYLDGTTVGPADFDALSVATAAIQAGAVTDSKVAAASLRGTKLDPRYTYRLFQNSPHGAVKDTGAVVAGASAEVDVLTFGDGQGQMEQRIIVGQTILLPVLTAVGLDIGMDQVATHGIELGQGILGSSRAAFVARTDLAFFFEVQVKVAAVLGCTQLMAGFRKAAAYQAAIASYTDFAAIGMPAAAASPSPIKLKTNLASAGVVTTDTTNTWADGATKKLRVSVSAAGVVTYQINGAAPTTVAAYTFGANTVVPFLAFINAGTSGTVELISWECGFQADA